MDVLTMMVAAARANANSGSGVTEIILSTPITMGALYGGENIYLNEDDVPFLEDCKGKPCIITFPLINDETGNMFNTISAMFACTTTLGQYMNNYQYSTSIGPITISIVSDSNSGQRKWYMYAEIYG